MSRLYTLQVHLSKWECGVLRAVVQDRDASFRVGVFSAFVCRTSIPFMGKKQSVLSAKEWSFAAKFSTFRRGGKPLEGSRRLEA